VLGDEYVVTPLPNGLMMAVVDGLGHGAEAAAVAALAVETLSANASLPVPEILARCHERLRGTRGATVSVASFDYDSDVLTWSGLGNVMGVLLRADPATRPRVESLVQRAGVLGSGWPSMIASRVPVRHGDLVVLATDGISPGFEDSVDRGRHAQDVADRIVTDRAKHTDDAMVLAARYLGAQP
jgi:serine/threonine protein phosphatase PrpC